MTKTTQTRFRKALLLPVETRTDLVALLLSSILEADRAAGAKSLDPRAAPALY